MSEFNPDAALKDIRHWLREARLPGISAAARDDRCARVATAVEALDEWLTKGGALPAEWARPRECVVLDGEDLKRMVAILIRRSNDARWEGTLRVEPYPAGLKYKLDGGVWSPIVGHTERLD